MRTLILSFLFFLGASHHASAQTPGELTERALPGLVELYKWFHANPELSNNEMRTSARLAEELRGLGLVVEEGIGGHGVVGVLRGRQPGPVVLYRADMDALPITEATGLPYASKNPGVMHACGHDLHMTVAVGTLQVLSEMKDRWNGTVLFVGQPAEELGAGAKAMLADPKFQEILTEVGKPNLALALHDNAEIPAGTAALTSGYVTANVDSVDIKVHGVGGHGAVPDASIDPIVIGSEIVTALQTIISRRLPPGTRAVVTVGRFQGGSKRNIIPPGAELNLTVRSYEDEVRERLLEEIERTAVGVAQAHNAPRPPDVIHLEEGTPSGFNDPAWVERLRPLFLKIVGEEGLREVPPGMIGEDFARYPRELKIPGVMFLLGAADPEAVASGEPLPGLHSDRFAPDAPTSIRTGTLLVITALLEALSEKQ